MVGEVTARKGQILALQALSSLRDSDWHALVIGEGDGSDELRSLLDKTSLGDRVSMTGALSRDEVQGILVQRPIFVSLSLRDSGGMALLEAAAAGCPLVFLGVGGPSQLMGSLPDGVIPPGSPPEVIKATAAALERVMNDAKYAEYLGNEARALAMTHDWSTKRQALEWLYGVTEVISRQDCSELRERFDAVTVAGMSVCKVSDEQAAPTALAETGTAGGRLYTLVNAHSAKLRRESPDYAALLADAERCVNLPDGASVTYAARLLGYGDIGRCPGPDLMEAVCAGAAIEGTPIFLLGGADGVASALADALRLRHEGLVVAGTATPPFGEWSAEENRRLIEAVRASGARILFMGVSAPKQEIWAYGHLDELQMPIVCVGAAFDFGTGTKSRAPEWMRKAGLEWVHRLFSEPGRMWKRYLVGNTLFMWDVIRYGRRPAPLSGERT